MDSFGPNISVIYFGNFSHSELPDKHLIIYIVIDFLFG